MKLHQSEVLPSPAPLICQSTRGRSAAKRGGASRCNKPPDRFAASLRVWNSRTPLQVSLVAFQLHGISISQRSVSLSGDPRFIGAIPWPTPSSILIQPGSESTSTTASACSVPMLKRETDEAGPSHWCCAELATHTRARTCTRTHPSWVSCSQVTLYN